jgi:hypothetical protein
MALHRCSAPAFPYRTAVRHFGVRSRFIMLKAHAVSTIRAAVTTLARTLAAVSKVGALRHRKPSQGLKALLAAAPLEGIELDRAHDCGREVDL